VATGKNIATFSGWQHAWPGDTISPLIRALAFSPDGKTLVTTGHGMAIKVWDIAPNDK
jgi:WD40 repeat protein